MLYVYAILLAVASLLPSGRHLPPELRAWDALLTPTWQNALHVPAYAVLAALALLAAARRGHRGRRAAAVVVGTCVAYGALLEWLQAAIPGRTPSLADAFWNAAGALLGVLLAAPATRPHLGP